jgi:hypothetical protein
MIQLTQITPVAFPLNLGTADSLYVNVNTYDNGTSRIFYVLFDTSSGIRKKLTSEFLYLTEEQVTANGNDINWVTNYVVEQLGLTLAL